MLILSKPAAAPTGAVWIQDGFSVSNNLFVTLNPMGAGNMVFVQFGASSPPTSITDDKGNTATIITSNSGISGYSSGYGYFLNVTAGARTVTMNSASGFPFLAVAEFEGPTVFDTSNQVNSGSVTVYPTGSIITAVNGSLCIGVGISSGSNPVISAVPPFVQGPAGFGTSTGYSYYNQPAAGSISTSWNVASAANGSASILAFH